MPVHRCECGKVEYDDKPHNHPKPSKGQVKSVEELEGKKPNDRAEAMKAVDKEINCLVSAYDGDITDLAAARLIINRQAKSIDSLQAYQELLKAACQEHVEQRKALEKNLHEEAASSVKTIKLLQERVKAKDEEMKSWRNKCVLAEDDANYYHSIFDGSWPTAIETLKATLASVQALKG